MFDQQVGESRINTFQIDMESSTIRGIKTKRINQRCWTESVLHWGVGSNTFYFHPDPWGNDPI